MMDSEKAVIGCILTDADSLYSVYEKLKPEMFADSVCRNAYEIALGMYDRNQTITPIELSRRLENNQIDIEDTVSFLADCCTAISSSVEIEGHANIIIQEYKSRTVKDLVEKVSFSARDIDDTIADLLTNIEALTMSKSINSKTLAEIVEEHQDNYFKDVEVKKIKTGFYKLDEVVEMEGGDTFVIGARPAVGKSAFVTQMIMNIAEKGWKVGYFNLEMSDKQVYERIVARKSKIGLNRVKYAKAYLEDEENQFKNANKQMMLNNLVISSGSKKISEIRAESRHQNFDVIVIDYLQLVKADRLFGNRASEVGDISKSIKGLAMELKIPIIILSQMNRLSDENKEPNISELRESGDIEQDASIIGLLWNINNEGLKGLKIAKNRQGKTNKISFQFEGDLMEFTETYRDFDDEVKKDEAHQKRVKEGMPWEK